jgi:hypothetical protein
LEAALVLWREHGDCAGTAYALQTLANVAQRSQSLERAQRLLEAAVAVLVEGGLRWTVPEWSRQVDPRQRLERTAPGSS